MVFEADVHDAKCTGQKNNIDWGEIKQTMGSVSRWHDNLQASLTIHIDISISYW